MKENKILHNVIYYDYDQKLFPFKDVVTNLFEIDDLENIHNLMDKTNDEWSDNDEELLNSLLMYGGLENTIGELYV